MAKRKGRARRTITRDELETYISEVEYALGQLKALNARMIDDGIDEVDVWGVRAREGIDLLQRMADDGIRQCREMKLRRGAGNGSGGGADSGGRGRKKATPKKKRGRKK